MDLRVYSVWALIKMFSPRMPRMGVYLDWASKPWTFNGSFTVLILNFTQHLGGLKMSEALQENNTFKQSIWKVSQISNTIFIYLMNIHPFIYLYLSVYLSSLLSILYFMLTRKIEYNLCVSIYRNIAGP